MKELIARLNNYDGDNVWEDVIHAMDDPHGSVIDWEATEAADPGGRSDIIILVTGETVEWERGEWKHG